MKEPIAYLLNDTARLYRREFNARTRHVGFTALQWRLLHQLRFKPGIRQGPLADIIEVEPITLSRMLDRLQDNKLVERRADPSDRRAWQLFLTQKAEELMIANRPISEEINQFALQGISEEEQQLLYILVRRIHNNLSYRSASTTEEAPADFNPKAEHDG